MFPHYSQAKELCLIYTLLPPKCVLTLKTDLSVTDSGSKHLKVSASTDFSDEWHYIYIIYLADAFIQNDLHCIQVIHLIRSCIHWNWIQCHNCTFQWSVSLWWHMQFFSNHFVLLNPVLQAHAHLHILAHISTYNQQLMKRTKHRPTFVF